MIVTVLQMWLNESRSWGFDLLRIEPWDRALLSVYRSRISGWEVKLLFINVL